MVEQVKLIILIEVEAGKAQQQIDLYQKIKPLVVNEAGCLEYQLNRVSGKENSFVLTECWASEADLALHDATQHMQDADALSPSFRAGPATVLRLCNL